MPRVKIDYIVSFSSEDKENPASNLLAWEINKKKWLCREWEPSCSVVLQLAKAIQIDSVNIGVHHAALVEVLVGLSEKPNDPFEVLVPSCVFVSATDSRRSERVERVRGFSGEQLSAARTRRWDRVRVVCSQPYNKRIQYGLSFVHINSSEIDNSTAQGQSTAQNQASTPDAQAPLVAASVPLSVLSLLGLDTYSSDDDEFRPGELFAQRNSNTDAQIRQASSQALNRVSDASTKLVKTPIARTNKQKQGDEQQTDRRRDSLLYTEDDDRPNNRIDRLVQNHRIEQEKVRKHNPNREFKNDSKRAKRERSREKESESGPVKRNKAEGERDKSNVEVQHNREAKHNITSERNKFTNKNGKTTENRGMNEQQVKTGAGGGGVLAGVVFSISGYENPRRARVRDAAVRLGARYDPHTLSNCTHLLCAFPNTPKLRELQRVRPDAHAVRAEWVEHADVARRRLSEAPYAPGRALPAAPPAAASPSPPPPPVSDADTDDEIERAMLAAAGGGGAGRGESETEVVREEESDGDDTDPDEPPPKCQEPEQLPALFAGAHFVVEATLPARTATLLARYLRAYGALVLQPDEVLDEGCIDYVVCGGDAGWEGAERATRVTPHWVWRCHRKKKVCTVRD